MDVIILTLCIKALLSPSPGAFLRGVREGRGGRESTIPGEFQEVAPGGHDPGDRGRGGLNLCPETPLNAMMMTMKTPTSPRPA